MRGAVKPISQNRMRPPPFFHPSIPPSSSSFLPCSAFHTPASRTIKRLAGVSARGPREEINNNVISTDAKNQRIYPVLCEYTRVQRSHLLLRRQKDGWLFDCSQLRRNMFSLEINPPCRVSDQRDIIEVCSPVTAGNVRGTGTRY